MISVNIPVLTTFGVLQRGAPETLATPQGLGGRENKASLEESPGLVRVLIGIPSGGRSRPPTEWINGSIILAPE